MAELLEALKVLASLRMIDSSTVTLGRPAGRCVRTV